MDSVWEQEKLEARKCLKMPQNPTRQVHALLGSLSERQLFCLKKNEQNQACFLISVDYRTVHPTQRGVDLLGAEERTCPERESGKPDQFVHSEFLDQFEFWLKLLDILGIIKAPLVGCARAPDV